MSIGANMFDALTPPAIWITLHELDHVEADVRKVSIRVKETGRRSVSAHVVISKYSPEDSVMTALAATMRSLAGLQKTITSSVLKEVFEEAVRLYVEPF